ncbi:MAG: FtsX-like permease family protein [Roseivirga sp.]|nr:FtsX-like permease family protein [Roseivirga sp.]
MPESYHTPPALYARLFRKICRDELFEELHGDLMEEFHLNSEEQGVKKARSLYKKEVIKLIRPSVIKRSQKLKHQLNNTTMFRNYTKVAFRSLAKNKLFTFINITGLAIGMSVGLLIVNLVFDALKFDQFHTKKDRIYRVLTTPKRVGFRWDETATAPNLLGLKMKEELPGVEEVVRIRRRFSGRIKKEDGSLFTQGIYADDNFFKVFSFDLKQGNPTEALANPFSIILTETLAETLMPGENAMGKLLTIPDRGEFLVTGIVADPPVHSHVKFDVIVSFNTVAPLEQQGSIYEASTDWEDFSSSYVYFLLEEGQNLENVQAWLDKAGEEIYEPYENLTTTFATQSITSIVPGKDLNNQIGAELIPLPIIILGAVAMMIVLSACFNYTNLSIARAMRRAKEIGVRKMVGSSRKQIFNQFTVETVMVTVIAVFFSAMLFAVIKPLFITSIPRIDLIMQFETPPVLYAYFLLFAVFIGLIAGLFPALFFSRIKPLAALRSGSSMKLFSRVNIRKALIVVQFSISILFLITMNVVSKQYRYSMAYEMGFEKENILNITLNGNDAQRLTTELEKIPEINKISASSMLLGTGAVNRTILKNPQTNDSLYNSYISATPDFFDIHGLELLAGEIYEPRQPEESLNKMVVNEEFLRFQGYESPQDILGEAFYINTSLVTVVGVIRDFNFQYLEEPINPLMLFESPPSLNFLNLTVQGQDYVNTIDKIEKAWEKVDEDAALQARFLDAELEEVNGFLLIFVRVFGFLGIVAASIACLGLLGMAVFNAESRTKEIGVRKAVGANVGHLIMILSKSFMKLIGLAGVFGGLVAYFLLEKVVLAQTYYHVNVGILEVLSAALLLFGLAILAVGSQTWKAARANPVDSLRYE